VKTDFWIDFKNFILSCVYYIELQIGQSLFIQSASALALNLLQSTNPNKTGIDMSQFVTDCLKSTNLDLRLAVLQTLVATQQRESKFVAPNNLLVSLL
jgi:hypothetical protein